MGLHHNINPCAPDTNLCPFTEYDFQEVLDNFNWFYFKPEIKKSEEDKDIIRGI